MKINLLVVLIIVGLASCSARQSANRASEGSSQAPGPSTLTEAASSQKIRAEEVFYSEITVLIETVADVNCKDKVIPITVASTQPWLASVNDANVLDSKIPVDRTALNITVEYMGLDSGRIERSLIDHGSLKEGERYLLFRRRPGLALELSYLGESLILRGDATPVYSFTAREKRNECDITHNVNVFQDRSGLFKRK